jgi:hypothetical protein
VRGDSGEGEDADRECESESSMYFGILYTSQVWAPSELGSSVRPEKPLVSGTGRRNM